jgi:hypothetical protein
MTNKLNCINSQRKDLWMRGVVWACFSIFLIGLMGLVIPVLANAETITWETLSQRIAEAKTAADHEAIADFYKAQATIAGEQIKYHESMMNAYGVGADNYKSPRRDWMNSHCENLIKSYRAEQVEYEKLAKEHGKMAKELSDKK